MSVDQITAYAVDLRIYRDQASVTTPGEYLEIPLPDEVAGFEDVEVGKKSFYANLQKNEDISYVRYTPDDDSSRHFLKLKEKSGSDPSLAVSLPTEYAVTNGRSPFQGMEHGDRVNIEIREEENEIRVYTPEDFPHRVKQLSEEGTLTDFDTPVVAPVLGTSEEFTDLSVGTDLPSQKFRIVPFDGQHDVFLETAREQALDEFNAKLNPQHPDYESKKEKGTKRIKESDSFRARKNTLYKVRDEHGIPVTSVDELAISWCPKCEHEDIDNLLARGYRAPEPPAPDIEDQIIYRESNTECGKVALPAKGSFFVIVEKDGETNRLPFFHREENPLKNNSYSSFDREYEKEWGILLKNHEEMPPTIYVPVHLGGKVSWTKYG